MFGRERGLRTALTRQKGVRAEDILTEVRIRGMGGRRVPAAWAWRRSSTGLGDGVDAGLGVEAAGSGEFVASEQSSPGGLPGLGRRGAPGTRRRSSCSDSGGAAARLRAAARVGEAA